MLIVDVWIVGGVVYAGIKTLTKLRPKKSAAWLNDGVQKTSAARRLETESEQLESRAIRTEKSLQRNFAVSSVSLGLTTAGALLYPPLGVASVPLNVYTSIPTLEQSYEFLLRKRRSVMPLVTSFAIMGTMVSGHYFWSSLIDWVYYYFKLLGRRLRDLNRYLLQEVATDSGAAPFSPFGGNSHSTWVQVGNVQRETPIEELEVGDVVVVHQGEMMPVDGRVVEGSAVISPLSLERNAQGAEIKEGDYISALSVVRSGQISVQVERI